MRRVLTEEERAEAAVDDPPAKAVPPAAVSTENVSPQHVLALQRGVGNQAVVRYLAAKSPGSRPALQRAPQVADPAPLDLTGARSGPLADPGAGAVGFDPTVGIPVPGYEAPRATYTKADRDAIAVKVNDRMKENNGNVMGFAGTYSSAVTSHWGTHVTHEMSRAEAKKALSFWGNLTKFVLETAITTALTGGAGFVAKELAVLAVGAARKVVDSKVIQLFGEQAIGFGVDQGGGAAEDLATEDGFKAARAKLDAKTKDIASIVGDLHRGIVGELNIPWVEYGRWLASANDQELAKFRLPHIFPPIPPDAVMTAAVAAVVAALHEPHSHDELPDEIGADPTERDAMSYFDDYQIVAHLRTGVRGRVSLESAQVYVPSPKMRQQLIGRAIGSMGPIPLFVAVAPEDDAVGDLMAATELAEALQEAANRAFGTNQHAGPVPPWLLRAYPGRKRQLRITRSVKAEDHDDAASSGLGAGGGGLAEHLFLYHWASSGSGLRSLADDVVQQHADAFRPNPRRREAPGSDFPVSAAAAAAHRHLAHWQHRGALHLLTNYVSTVKPTAPESRWDDEYFDKGSRKRILKR